MLKNNCVRRMTILTKKSGLTEDICASDINMTDISPIFYCIPTATMVSTIFLSTILIILTLTVNVKSQTCNNAVQYSLCSSNSGCGCLPYSFSDTMGVCGLLNQSCSAFDACQSPNDACTQSGYICVRHPRCSANPLCYPSTMFHEDICPPIIVSNYATALDISDGTYTRPATANSNYYYEAIQIVVNRTGTYNLTSLSYNDMDNHGYLYNNTFYPFDPSTNLIMSDDDRGGNNQFLLNAYLEAGVSYTLVVSAHNSGVTGSYTAIASGPGGVQFTPIDPMSLTTTTSTLPPRITSYYSNALTINSGNYSRYGVSGSYYYHAIEVRVTTAGSYTFGSSSTIADTYGYLYQGNFYPSYPQYNVVALDDDSSGNNQFGITFTLRSDITYILVFTTFAERATGSFDVTATGPGNVDMNQLDINRL